VDKHWYITLSTDPIKIYEFDFKHVSVRLKLMEVQGKVNIPQQ